jgi:CheY-like chemotaxis protein
LIVDDMPVVREVVRVTLQLSAFDVIGEAEDGLEAFALAFHLRPDFVVLDYRMPRMNGAEAAELIRTVRPEIAIVAFSSDLQTCPPWADARVPKDGVSGLVEVLKEMAERRELTETAPSHQLTLI